jgi:hypothetical protein
LSFTTVNTASQFTGDIFILELTNMVMNELFDRFYYPYTDEGDSESNRRALESAFEETDLAGTWQFILYLGLGIESTVSQVWLTEIMFLNNPDIPL